MIGKILYWLFIYPVSEIIEICYTVLYRVTNSYGVATIGLSFAVTLLTLPIYMVAEHWQGVERDKEMAMAPKVGRIRKAFRGDERFMVLSAYYREQGYKPYYALRSAFSILVQIPFFMAAYSLLSGMEALRGCSFWFLKDLGKPDRLLNLWGHTLNLLPVVMTLANVIAGYIYSKGHPVREKVQIYGMAALFLLILYNSPSGLLLYWTMNNVLSLVKNLFYKLKHPAMLLYALCSLACVGADVVMVAANTGKPSTWACLFLGTALVVALPLELWVVNRLLDTWLSPLVTRSHFRDRLFFLSMTGLALLLGLFIPSSLIATSPTEFAFLEPYRSPLAFVAITIFQAAGLCLVWPCCLYRLFGKRIQAVFAFLAVALFLLALLDLFAFPQNYGSVLVNLQFTDISSLGRKGMGVLMELAAIPLVFLLLLLLCRRPFEKVMVDVLLLLLLTLSAIGVVKMVGIGRAYRVFIPRHEEMVKNNESGGSSLAPVFTFSKTGKNVLVIMMDRALSCYVPTIMDEKPQLKEQLDGFTYYPNTISFGGNTIYGAPALYGGYEYTPLEINKRSDESLKQKHNEALKMLPKLFSNNGYQVVFTDPSWSNYNWDFDATPFEGMENVKVDSLKGRYNTWWLEHRYEGDVAKTSSALECNLLRYALLQVTPAIVHSILYDNGSWLNKLNPRMSIGGLRSEFLNWYCTLDVLPLITSVVESGDRLNIMESEETHEPTILQTPDYVPVSEPNNVLDTPYKNRTMYHVNAAAYRELVVWFDYLKEQGVYDNTRIILVSDHGWGEGKSAPDYLNLPGGKDLNELRALLMVKDFGKRGELKEDGKFMTVADVPELATQEVIQEPENPYTHTPLQTQKEDGVVVTSAGRYTPRDNKPNQFIVDPGQWLEVKDDIFNIDNWKQVNP